MRAELNWLVQNIHLTLLSNPSHLIIASGASIKSGGESFSRINPCANGQCSCTVKPHYNKEDTKQSFVTIEQRDMRPFNEKWDHDYCRVSSRGNEQGCTLSVTERDGFKQVEAKPSSISKKMQLVGNPRFGSFCILSVSPSSGLHAMETTPLQQRQGCFLNFMDSHTELCFPNFLSDCSGFNENGKRSGSFDFNNTNVAGKDLVSTTSSNGCQKPFSSTKDAQSIDRSTSGKSCISRKRKLTTPS